jgi:hypothetical protein
MSQHASSFGDREIILSFPLCDAIDKLFLGRRENVQIVGRLFRFALKLEALEVTADSESDDLGILGISEETSAGPLSVSVRVSLGSTRWR